jgi:hypothetical protein
MAEETAQIFHKPNWHPALTPLLGEIVGQQGYVTEYGTIELLGIAQANPNISKFQYESSINGPTLILSAESSTGLM